MDITFTGEDTICAIATPVGEGGIGIIKISGPEALRIAKSLFLPHRPMESLESHRLYHGWVRDPETGTPVDEVLLSYMAAPNTYTREDVVEINCHSGYAVLDRLLEIVLASGARLAHPGEFTRRAFLNGRIDLSQAEAVIDVIRSRSQQSLELAGRQLQGAFREKVLHLRERVLLLQSELEAHIDFSDDLDEESSDAESLTRQLDDLSASMRGIAAQYESGRILREGLTLVLVGKPNVGKSSLLNALLGKDRAIVTPHPGTTRDVIEDSFILSGVMVRVLDTAGIRREPDEIESIGIERTLQSVDDADIVLWLIDQSRPLGEEDEAVFRAISSTSFVILMNKADLPPATSIAEVKDRFGDAAPIISLSAINTSDVDLLRSYLGEAFLRKPLEQCRSTLVPNLRQKECFDRAAESLARARELLAGGGFSELAGYEIRSARKEMDSVLGLDGDDELLDRIFSQFCIGK